VLHTLPRGCQHLRVHNNPPNISQLWEQLIWITMKMGTISETTTTTTTITTTSTNTNNYYYYYYYFEQAYLASLCPPVVTKRCKQADTSSQKATTVSLSALALG